ncbi:metallophosphoesterase [Phycisphaerales bacterium AB-hyl4]|uniref:Metallophosphoesterase n=1 Tax=Natronomicrosphaera hydrolytica TaxID=3242702 RepID=A0ABV4U5C5_9BACT
MTTTRLHANFCLLLAMVLMALTPATDANDQPLRIAVMGDLHLSPDDDHQPYRDNLDRILAQINDAAVDLVLVAGDLTLDGHDDQYAQYNAAIGQLDANVLAVPGNRDVGHKPLPGGGASITADRLASFQSHVGDAFFTEHVAPDLRVIGVNASLFTSGLDDEQSQWDMLERELAQPDDRVTILLTHYPLFLEEHDERETYFNLDRDSRDRLLGLIEQGNVAAVLSAHTHRTFKLTHASATFISIPPVSFGMPRDEQSPGWTLLTFDANGQLTHEHQYLDPLMHRSEGERSSFGDKLAAAGPFAVLPGPDEGNHVLTFLRRHGIEEKLHNLTPEQVIDPDVLNPEQYPAVFYLSPEQYHGTAEKPGDIEAALQRYMQQGGVLVVLCSGPLPFYVDEHGESSRRVRDRLSLMLLGSGESVHAVSGFEAPNAGDTLELVAMASAMTDADLPDTVPFPRDGDQRWRPMVPLTSADRYDRLITLKDQHGESRGDGAVYTERLDFDGSRRTRVLYAASLLTQIHPERDHMIEGTLRYLLKVLDEPATERHITTRATASREAPVISDRVHVFYYNWYGAPPHQDSYVHWQQGGHTPPEQIGANFYPLLGAYSSSDPAVLRQHMIWIRQSGAGVLSLTWWGRDSYEDQLTQPVLDAAAEAGLKVNFHHEPYEGRTAASTIDDFRYIIDRYGDHPAFYRASELDDRPMFYIFRSLDSDAADWREAIAEIRGTEYDSVVLAQTSDLTVVVDGDFDGGYTYDTIPLFESEERRRLLLIDVAEQFEEEGKIYVPSIGPGYVEDRAVPDGITPDMHVQTRDDNTGRTYEASWQDVIEANAPYVSITSFNEWHEGSQIEPAVPKATDTYTYQDYGDLDPRFYLHQTAKWVKQYEAHRRANADE